MLDGQTIYLAHKWEEKENKKKNHEPEIGVFGNFIGTW